MKRHPEEFKKLFCFQETKLTTFMLQTLFSTSYCSSGSNCCTKDAKILKMAY